MPCHVMIRRWLNSGIGTVWENGHYTIPILRRQERPNFPDNKFVVQRWLDSTVHKLEHTELMEKYEENMQTMLSDGYAKPVPECDLDLSDGSVWFLLHHPVINESRPGKVKIVHDGAAKLIGINFNKQCFSGTGLSQQTNSCVVKISTAKFGYHGGCTSDVHAGASATSWPQCFALLVDCGRLSETA